MKKILIASILTLAALGSYNMASAQLQKGNLLLGGQVGNINFGRLNDNNTNFSMSFSPRVGYFVVDNLAVGLANPWGITWGDNYNITHGGLTVFGRYYFNDAKTIVLNKARFFVGIETGFGSQRVKDKISYPEPAVIKSSYGIFDVEAGFAYFLTSNVALEAALELKNTFHTNNSNSALGIRLGFQIHIPTARMKEAYQDVKYGN